jgi:hypothetical protein
MENFDPKKYNHLKVEALCAELLRNGLSFENIVLSFAGSFKKRFRKDIDAIKVLQDDNGKDILEIQVNRDSIYDLLPEGVFHQPIARNKNASLGDIVADFRRLKEEEKNARKFFRPFENEFARYVTFVEEQERNFAADILSGNISGSFSEFWGLPKGLPNEASAMLAKLLPWAYIIKGDLKLTAKALQIILNKEIDGVEKNINAQEAQNNDFQLNDVLLGVDMVTGNCFEEPSVCWMFTINDILANEMEQFTDLKPFGKLLKLFVEIFVPIEIDVIFEYKTEQFAADISEKILGYGFTL